MLVLMFAETGLRKLVFTTGDAALELGEVIALGDLGDPGAEVCIGAEIVGLLELDMVGEVPPIPNNRVERRLPAAGLEDWP